jgi:chromosome segregation protein
MKIKKITIHGFKSFADKVSLSFPSGTSGIIGPNGCGKSNIVDAVRWVIGEQNPRHLRGKLMEDVIFNGSDSRKPLGMAEVVLTFSNESGRAPARFADFTEIEISRRLYRSGESEYSINKVQCRLRDIAELFMDTGIGTRAYSIVEQGQVGWLINAKAADRRVIFEEAAGINKFKQKKEAALRRLESTRDNLTRVSDIIVEVKRQLNSLNRQAKKAERYKLVKDELKGVDLKLSSIEFSEMTAALGTATGRLDDIKDKEAALFASIGTLESLSVEVKQKCIDEEEGYRGARDNVVESERRIQEAERTSALAAMRVEELTRNAERLALEIEELKDSALFASGEITALKGSIEGSQSLIEEESARVEQRAASLDGLLARLKEREGAERGETAEALKIATRLTDIRHALQTCLSDEGRMREKEARAGSEREETARKLSLKEDPARLLKERLASSEREQAGVEAELGGGERRLAELTEQRALALAAVTRTKDFHAKAAARLMTIEEMERSFENAAQGVRSIMRKGADKGGIHRLIADVIETSPGFEKAVDAVMGDRLNYVIVESHAEGVEAIEYLKQHAGGRSSFISTMDLRPVLSPVPALATDYPGTRELREEVRAKDGYSDIVDCLLGDVLIVENLETALDIWRQNAIYKTLVTLEGEVVNPTGVITGGNSNGTDPGVLQRRGEVKTIREEVLALEARLARDEAVLGETGDEAALTEASIEQSRKRLHKAELERVGLLAELNSVEEEVRRLNADNERCTTEIEDAVLMLADISARKATLAAERKELEEAAVANELRSKDLEVELASMAEEKEALSGALTELKVSLAATKERYTLIKTQTEDKESLLREIENKIILKTNEIAGGADEITAKIAVGAELKLKVDEQLALIDGAKAEELARRETLAGYTAELERTEKELKELKAESAGLQGRSTELALELKETELNVRHLKERIIERYGVEIESVQSEASEADDDATLDMEQLGELRTELRAKIESMGEVSLSALDEFNDLESRYKFLLDQQADLAKSVDSIYAAIKRINRVTRERFTRAFDEINVKFKENFPKLFNGGRAELRLEEAADVLEAGIEIVAQPPGKRLQSIALLSGGEKALTAIALIFSIFLVKPSPFCMLDEVDAPLDDANIDRFNAFVAEMSTISQFLLVTHNKRTMEMTDALYGITMEEPGVSKIISVNL